MPAQPRNSKGQFVSAKDADGVSDMTLNAKALELQDKYLDVIANAVLTRQQFIDNFLDSRRDIDKECGYKDTAELTVDDYVFMYDREPVATRVVEVLPEESWKVQPSVFETENTDEETEFEKAWAELPKKLRASDSGELLKPDEEGSWFQDEEGNPIWDILNRVDVLCGIGAYGVLLLGVNDGKELSDPVEPSDSNELIFLRAMDEYLVSIDRFETDESSPRYGMPVEYSIELSDPNHSATGLTPQSKQSKRTKVHWTRVIHVADNLHSSPIFGIPRMQPVFNRLYDLRKLYSGSAEMYWMGAFPGFGFETHPQLGGNVKLDTESIRTQMTKYKDGLQRYLGVPGMTIKSLAPQVVDPTPQILTQIEAICIRLGIPKRIFMGSERGELASGQDSKTWNDRLMKRQRSYITPRIIVPFVDRLIRLGVLPQPEGYSVRWPDLNTMSPEERANTVGRRTEAMSKYVNGGVDSLMDPLDFLTRELGFEDAEAEAILQATLEHLEETAEEEAIQEPMMTDEPVMEGEEENVVEEPTVPPKPGGEEGNLPITG